MKKITVTLLSALLVLSLTACGNNNQNIAENTRAEASATAAGSLDSGTESAEGNAGGDTESEAATDTVETGSSNILIAYFSVMETDGVDTVSGASRVAVNGNALGNNQYIASNHSTGNRR